jgi:arylsulfatase A
MTGRYGFRTHWYHNDMKTPVSLAENNTIFAQILQHAGYVTAIAGKWQLFGTQKEYGFDESCIWAYENYLPEGVAHTGAYEKPGKPSRYWHPCILNNGAYQETRPDDYGPDLFTDFVIDFARRHKDQPFLAYYAMCLTHGPFYPTPDSLEPGADKMRNDREKNFGANVAYMDKLVGRIAAALEELGIRDNTVLFFTTDNGTGGVAKNRPREIGCRVPMIVNCPGLVRSLGACDELIDFSDVLPTLAELGGARVPENYILDGRSFAPLLLGRPYEQREWIFSYLADKRMLRDKRWLLEGDGRFYDCGDRRDGIGYKDVTESADREAVAARARFDDILANLPAPGPDDPASKMRRAPAAKRKRRSTGK